MEFVLGVGWIGSHQATLCFGSPHCHLLLFPIFPCCKYKPLLFQSLVVKPDQLIKRRGKLGLVGVNLTLDGVKSWLKPRLGQEATVSLGVGSGWMCCGNRSKCGRLQISTVGHPPSWSDCSLGKAGARQSCLRQQGPLGARSQLPYQGTARCAVQVTPVQLESQVEMVCFFNNSRGDGTLRTILGTPFFLVSRKGKVACHDLRI